MDHHDHVNLLRDGATGKVWADLGSGTGAFTLALADLIGAEGVIYSIDRNQGDLSRQQKAMQEKFPLVTVHYKVADFTKPLELPPLDGIVMANALHFVAYPQQVSVLQQIRGYLKPDGHLLLVEYDTDRGNTWVPYPMSYATWENTARKADFSQTKLLATHPSRFLGQIFSAVSL